MPEMCDMNALYSGFEDAAMSTHFMDANHDRQGLEPSWEVCRV
jgi:hypothetical protein